MHAERRTFSIRLKLIVIAFLFLAPIGTAQTPTRADNWDPLRSLVGIWEGTGNGQPGEMLRVAKREGVLSFAVWDKGELNPFSYLITDVLARHFGDATPADPNAPGAFRFADHGSLARILAEAGAVGVGERVLKFQIAALISLEQFWQLRSETSGLIVIRRASYLTN